MAPPQEPQPEVAHSGVSESGLSDTGGLSLLSGDPRLDDDDKSFVSLVTLPDSILHPEPDVDGRVYHSGWYTTNYCCPQDEELVSRATNASHHQGHPIDRSSGYPQLMKEAGFIDIIHEEIKWPINGWPAQERPSDPSDERQWEQHLGNLVLKLFDYDLEGLFVALLCRYGDMAPEAATALCAQARLNLRDTNIHAYWKLRY
ncbi:hypothetical protein SPBR_07197 [Sporothrix brasiliensis 5110]|uniref:Uncharacterized protein n=1 Tax=Sporothrix brasiliensis 5110 TaxID=1398154 RepID=A0A0C2EQV6_9PEZI|nr:uncharacterized protein SPBR_07197 [Sporothrix brasiliensis 5110]KIH88709.1 hypothetical protein SPBR_07197 [Sporothrix brasiliensis 5110]